MSPCKAVVFARARMSTKETKKKELALKIAIDIEEALVRGLYSQFPPKSLSKTSHMIPNRL